MCVCVCVCVRACVCTRPSTVKASSVWIRWDIREQINGVMLKTLNSYADSIRCYFRMQNLTFQLAALSCSGRATTYLVYISLAQRCQLLKIKCGWNANSANQPANYCKSPNRSPGVKTPKAFAIWPQYCTGRSYLGTKLLIELKYSSSVIYNY